ncbi:hypothetical protein [Streptomyces brasiliscabiei]
MFGFLQMDGHLHRGVGQKGKLTVEINARDIDILRNFQELTPYYSRITERTRSTNFARTHRSATWSLCSLEARARLNELGLPYGPKSKTISPPDHEFSHRDYLRGVIDADGSIGWTSKGLPFLSLTTASTAISAFLCRYAQGITGAERNSTRNTRDDIYNVLYMMEFAQDLAADLYYPGCLSLKRKQAVADALTDWVRPAGMRSAHTRRRWTEYEDRVLLQLDSSIAAAEQLGRTEVSCGMRL